MLGRLAKSGFCAPSALARWDLYRHFAGLRDNGKTNVGLAAAAAGDRQFHLLSSNGCVKAYRLVAASLLPTVSACRCNHGRAVAAIPGLRLFHTRNTATIRVCGLDGGRRSRRA